MGYIRQASEMATFKTCHLAVQGLPLLPVMAALATNSGKLRGEADYWRGVRC